LVVTLLPCVRWRASIASKNGVRHHYQYLKPEIDFLTAKLVSDTHYHHLTARLTDAGANPDPVALQ
jgi:hypothetical protein